jgi:1-acyl-sn-glycerol-3-phosphate acyltransferase
MKLRGYLTVGCAGLVLTGAELVQRLIVAPTARLLPSRRLRVLTAWQHLMAWAMLTVVRMVGGARIPSIPRIPGEPGVLILMNHQSLMDIPIVVASIDGSHPRIVTRARYARGKPLISHMLRLYQYPLVEPGATTRARLEKLATEAAESPVPVAIYPEGTRTRDGSLGRWRRGGLDAILAAREWSVYLMVVDGFWTAARLADFVSGVGKMDGLVERRGPFPSPGPGADEETREEFVTEMRTRMKDTLASMRGGRPE